MPVEITEIRDICANPDTWKHWQETAGRYLRDYLPPDAGRYSRNLMLLLNGAVKRGEELDRVKGEDGDRIEIVYVPNGPLAPVGLMFGFSAAASFISGAAQAGYEASQREHQDINWAVPGLMNKRLWVLEEQLNPARGWAGFQTTSGAGRPIPLVFGQVRCAGQIIASGFEPRFDKFDDSDGNLTIIPLTARTTPGQTRLNTRVAYCGHEVEEISGLQINDVDIEDLHGVVYETKLGTNRERAPDGFDEVKNVEDISTNVTVAGGAVVNQTDQQCDSVELKLTFINGLYETESGGENIERSVEVKFEYKLASAGSYTNYGNITISQMITSPFSVWVRFPRWQYAIYDIRVTRITADSTGSVEDIFEWDLMQTVICSYRSHPGIAEVAYRQIPLDQQQAPYRYTAVVKGVNSLRIYSDPGTYTIGWSNNPAWCLAWWITHPDHGLGRYFPSYDDDIDLQSFCDFAADCDEMVDNGRGGLEKRCTFNYEFNGQLNAQDFLAKFTEATRAFPPVYSGGKWRIILDKDEKAIQLFNEGNIKPGSLVYHFLPIEERPGRVLVNFQNEDNNYRTDTFLQDDPSLGEDDYPNDSPYSFAGATRSSQIARMAMRVIEMGRLRAQEVEFETGIEGYRTTIGRLIKVSSIAGGVGVASGKILDVSSNKATLTIDDDLHLDSGKTYEITVHHLIDDRLEQKILTGITDDPTQKVTVGNTLWDVLPQAGDGYAIGEVYYSTETYRVTEISLAEDYGRKIRGQLFIDIPDQIVANPYVDAQLLPSDYIPPGAVTNLTVEQVKPEDSGGYYGTLADVCWQAPSYIPGAGYVDHYDIFAKTQAGSQWTYMASAPEDGSRLRVAVGFIASTTYEVMVVAVTRGGARIPLASAASATVAMTN